MSNQTGRSNKAATHRKHGEKLLREIIDQDLVAREACYHNSCRREYTRPERLDTVKDASEETEMQDSHRRAFDHICKYVVKIHHSWVECGANVHDQGTIFGFHPD